MPKAKPVLYVTGLLLCGLAALMLLPAAADVVVGNPDWQTFVLSAAFTGFVGVSVTLASRGEGPLQLQLRQVFLLTTVSWLALAACAALPFLHLAVQLNYADAFFEAISGLTTTGSTVLVGLDAMPPGVLLWRSLLQWLGGVGIIVMAILVLPFLRVGGMQLFRSESSDRSAKVVARPAQLVGYIALIYVALTAACAIAYRITGMSLFDAVNHAMTTVSTGGYSTHDASFAAFENPATQWVATVFMVSGALPFVAYIRTAQRWREPIWRDSQVRALIAFLAAFSVMAAAWYALSGGVGFAAALTLVAFNVTSIVTTTGYASADYQTWGALAVGAIFFLTFLGGCTGSTSGAIKVFRFQVLLIVARAYLLTLLRPNSVLIARYQDRALPDDIAPSVLAFIFVYLASVVMLTMGLSAFQLDFLTSLSGAATALGNVGPGLGPIIGPAGNFSSLPEGAKWLLSAGMLLGRLELFTVLVLFQREFWRW
jgi:trk system potassium uptake protein TrkH